MFGFNKVNINLVKLSLFLHYRVGRTDISNTERMKTVSISSYTCFNRPLGVQSRGVDIHKMEAIKAHA
jgi:hypothetical protein